jgi:hypothetical protein
MPEIHDEMIWNGNKYILIYVIEDVWEETENGYRLEPNKKHLKWVLADNVNIICN